MASLGNDFYIAQKEGVEEEAARQDGAEVEISAGRAQGSTDEVVGLIENAITKASTRSPSTARTPSRCCRCCGGCSTPGIPLVLFDAPADELTDRARGLHRHRQPRRRRGRRRVAEASSCRRAARSA